ncbi:MAG TPA: hypothetical protein VLB69_04710 [Rudaea sp.]|nr:hypothetical protein [Rudaea sp.]
MSYGIKKMHHEGTKTRRTAKVTNAGMRYDAIPDISFTGARRVEREQSRNSSNALDSFLKIALLFFVSFVSSW